MSHIPLGKLKMYCSQEMGSICIEILSIENMKSGAVLCCDETEMSTSEFRDLWRAV